MRTDLERLFNPRSIAVIGASAELGTISGQPLNFLVKRGYAGTLYPVNPKYSELLGRRCYSSIEALPETPDLAIIAVAGEEAVAAVEACAARGVKVAVVMASGFGETGAAGLRIEQAMVETARRLKRYEFLITFAPLPVEGGTGSPLNPLAIF